MRLTRLYSRLVNASGLGRKELFPRLVLMTRYNLDGSIFEVAGPVEDYRVISYGGEEEFTGRILEAIGREDVFFDIGACVGLVSVHAAKKGACTYSFEPDPYWRSRLKRNLELNGLENVTIFEWAVSDREGEAVLFTDGTDGHSPSLRRRGKRGGIAVRTIAIDNALLSGELPVPDVVKIDIEGAEILALNGMSKLLASCRAPRAVFMEVHPVFLRDFGSSSEEVVDLMLSFGYRLDYRLDCHDQFHCIFLKGEDR